MKNRIQAKPTDYFDGVKIKTLKIFILIFIVAFTALGSQSKDLGSVLLFPSNNAKNVNPDTPLKITFAERPIIGQSGFIRIYDAENNRLVDSLDMSIPPGPKNTRTPAPYDKMVYASDPWDAANGYNRANRPKVLPPLEDQYQHKYIGGNLESDVYHFYPVLIYNNEAIITLHRTLEYGKEYYVQIDPGVLSFSDSTLFSIDKEDQWTFTTKKTSLDINSGKFIVSADGTCDFNTVQGALDFIQENNESHKTIFVRNGRYHEMVYFRNKNKITVVGEDREQVIIAYPNNGFFNPRPTGDRIEMIKRFRNRRSIFAVDNANDIHLINLTILSIGVAPAQNEGLLIKGERNIVNNVTIDASGDALQASGNIYMENTSIKGFGDNVLGYGAVFFKNCDFISTYGPHLWARNTSENHGNVLVNCKLYTEGDVEATYARAPVKEHYSFPYTEAVLINCAVEGLKPEGWGLTDSLCPNARCWEYNTVNLSDGKPADVSQRVHYSRQLTMENDEELIKDYSSPSYILNGWEPKFVPIIIVQPSSVISKPGESTIFKVRLTAIPDANYQWYFNNEPIRGEKSEVLTTANISKKNEGLYHVVIQNEAGSVNSEVVSLKMD